jgi:hypothetical protein
MGKVFRMDQHNKLLIASWIATRTNRASVAEGRVCELLEYMFGEAIAVDIIQLTHKARNAKVAQDIGLLKGKTDGSYNED